MPSVEVADWTGCYSCHDYLFTFKVSQPATDLLSDQDWATKHLTEPYNKILSSFSPLPRQHCIASARCNFKLWWSLPFPWLVCLHQRIVWTTFRRELWRPDIVWHSLLWRRSKLTTDYWLLTSDYSLLSIDYSPPGASEADLLGQYSPAWLRVLRPDWGSSSMACQVTPEKVWSSQDCQAHLAFVSKSAK